MRRFRSRTHQHHFSIGDNPFVFYSPPPLRVFVRYTSPRFLMDVCVRNSSWKSRETDVLVHETDTYITSWVSVSTRLYFHYHHFCPSILLLPVFLFTTATIRELSPFESCYICCCCERTEWL